MEVGVLEVRVQLGVGWGVLEWMWDWRRLAGLRAWSLVMLWGGGVEKFRH